MNVDIFQAFKVYLRPFSVNICPLIYGFCSASMLSQNSTSPCLKGLGLH